MLVDSVRSQFHAALSMLQQAVERCPPDLWHRDEDKNKFWQIAYHVLFYTHLYIQPSLEDFTPWSGHVADAEQMTPLADSADPLYTREGILSYIAFCREQVDSVVPTLDFDGESGFHWLPMSKAELQFYSLRHLQMHTGELAERLWAAAGVEVDWVGRGN